MKNLMEIRREVEMNSPIMERACLHPHAFLPHPKTDLEISNC